MQIYGEIVPKFFSGGSISGVDPVSPLKYGPRINDSRRNFTAHTHANTRRSGPTYDEDKSAEMLQQSVQNASTVGRFMRRPSGRLLICALLH